MSTVLEPSLIRAPRGLWRPWVLAAVGLAVLFVPTWVGLAQGAWHEDAHAHGPLVLALVAWMLWRERTALVDRPASPAPAAGALVLGLGLGLWLCGRIVGLPVFEAAAQLPVLAGTLLLVRGWATLRRLAFPVLFLAFVVPLPGFVLDTATAPLKALVSSVVEHLVAALGHDVVRQGVVLSVDGHEMLVADACSGLNSIASLFALTLFYLHATGPSSRTRWAVLLAAVVPLALLGNVLRVLALVLLTVYAGEAWAQGFLHTVAGLLVFVVALGSLLWIDRLFPRPIPRPIPRPSPRVSARLAPALFVLSCTALTATAAVLLRPVPTGEAIDLEAIVPSRFGGWEMEAVTDAVPPSPDVEANLERLYTQVLERTYVNGQGERMMLTIAHGGDQGDALKAHRQESCYAAQGFEIRGLEHARLPLPHRDIPVTRMLAVRGERSEPVTYWFTMGDRVVLSRLERLRTQLAWGFSGRVPDGVLVRVSSLSSRPNEAYAAQAAFLAALLQPLAPRDATRLAGQPESNP